MHSRPRSAFILALPLLLLSGAAISRAAIVHHEFNDGSGVHLKAQSGRVNVTGGSVTPRNQPDPDGAGYEFTIGMAVGGGGLGTPIGWPGTPTGGQGSDFQYRAMVTASPGTMVKLGTLRFGTIVGRELFGQQAPAETVKAWSCPAPSRAPGVFYFGFSFPHGGERRYGWIKVRADDRDSCTVLRLAWEDSGAPIAVGALPLSAPVRPPAPSISPARELSWPSEAGVGYQLQVSGDAVTWTDSGWPLVGSDAVMTAAAPPAAGRGFYRLKVVRVFGG